MLPAWEPDPKCAEDADQRERGGQCDDTLPTLSDCDRADCIDCYFFHLLESLPDIEPRGCARITGAGARGPGN